MKQHFCWFPVPSVISLHIGWKPLHTFYGIKIEKSTHTVCATILVGRIHCNLSDMTIFGGDIGLCACSANQKARFGSRNHAASV